MLVVSAPKDSRVANILIISGTQRKRRGRKKEERKGEAQQAGGLSVSVLTDEPKRWSRHDLSGDRSTVADGTESEDKDMRGHRDETKKGERPEQTGRCGCSAGAKE